MAYYAGPEWRRLMGRFIVVVVVLGAVFILGFAFGRRRH
jgi:hypothetical protein